MSKTNFDRLKILFFGTALSGLEYVSINDNRIEHKSIDFIENGGGSKVLGIELESGEISCQHLADTVNKYKVDEVSEYYFIMKRKEYIQPVLEAVESLSLGRSELYGIDPGYYYSFVPLMGENHRAVERYIAALKCNNGAKGTIKGILKSVLISLDHSHKLYEGFVVVTSMKEGLAMTASGKIC